ncbi:MAG: ABC transporter C-terminal domain-containing protein, partial [Leifsonia sp.]
GRLRHLPGGVDEYLRLRRAQEASGPERADASTASTPSMPPPGPALSGAALRAAEKELSALDRRLGKVSDQVAAKHEELARHDQSDYVGLGRLTEELRALEGEVADLETRWLELSEQLEA